MEVNIQNKVSRKLKSYRFKLRYAPYSTRWQPFKMIRILAILTVFFLTSWTTSGQTDTDGQEFKKIKVSTEWIEQVKSYDYSTNNATLIKVFEKLISPDTLIRPYYGNPRETG